MYLFLVAGYNTMNKENKDKVNGRFVGKVIGTMLLLSCLIIGTMLIIPQHKQFVLFSRL
ncbi:DUF3784 domain-containing protein [Enterococcus gallinarum]|uniref:DUF3784 domain-containing protein n=1 Tax=Enterococcus TaxID=1350 RepID=UPI00330767BA